jgi:hypothetical protein
VTQAEAQSGTALGADAADDGSHIWWGPIASERQAGEIIAWTAWSLILIGVAPAAALAISAIGGEVTLARPYYQNLGDNWYVIGQAAFLAVELIAALLLLRRRYWTAALVLFFCCVFVIVIVTATMARLSGAGMMGAAAAAQNGLLVICLLCFTRLAWRALEATAALRRLRMLEHFT